MIVKAWNNGRHHVSGSGYGIKIGYEDRRAYFIRSWVNVTLRFENVDKETTVNISKASFWSPSCGELISKEIGIWLINNGFARWNRGNPPELTLEPIKGNAFLLGFVSNL